MALGVGLVRQDDACQRGQVQPLVRHPAYMGVLQLGQHTCHFALDQTVV
jgi:hypothetical protein